VEFKSGGYNAEDVAEKQLGKKGDLLVHEGTYIAH